MSEMKPGERVNIFKDPMNMSGEIESSGRLVRLLLDDEDQLEQWEVHIDDDPDCITYERWINKTQVHE